MSGLRVLQVGLCVIVLCAFSNAKDEPSEDCGKLQNEPVGPENIPWLVAIYERYNGSLLYTCGGALIRSDVVLTAASCFLFSSDPEKFKVVVAPVHGDLAKNAADNRTHFFEVQRIELNKNYKSENGYMNNIALMRLAPSGADSEVQFIPVCLSSEKNQPGQVGQIIGSTFLEDSKNLTGLVATNLTIITNRKCMELLDDAPNRDQFCALPDHPTIILRKIGSGPFIVQKNGRHYLKGVLSHSRMVVDQPVILTSIPYQINWIRQTEEKILKKH